MRFLAFRNYNSITRLIKNMIYVLMSVSKNEKSVINDHPQTPYLALKYCFSQNNIGPLNSSGIREIETN